VSSGVHRLALTPGTVPKWY